MLCTSEVSNMLENIEDKIYSKKIKNILEIKHNYLEVLV